MSVSIVTYCILKKEIALILQKSDSLDMQDNH